MSGGARPFLSPDETDAPLVIDPDGVLAPTVAGQRFKPVCWWRAQVVEIARGMGHVELSQRLLLTHGRSGGLRCHPVEYHEFPSSVGDLGDHQIGRDEPIVRSKQFFRPGFTVTSFRREDP